MIAFDYDKFATCPLLPPHPATMLRLLRRPCSQQQLLRAGKAISSGATPRVPAGVPTPSSDDPASSNAVQLSVLLGSSVLLQLGAGMIVPCLPAYAASLDLPASSVGLIVAVPAFARACLNLPAGRLADIVGRKVSPNPKPKPNPNPNPKPKPNPNQRPMIVGSVLDAVGCLGTAMAGGLPSMAGSRLVMGAGSAIAGNATEAYTMDVVTLTLTLTQTLTLTLT